MNGYVSTICIWLCVCVSACAPPSNEANALPREMLTEQGHFRVTLTGMGSGLAVGLNRYQLELESLTNVPHSMLNITVQPWMPDHGHGSDREPTVQFVADHIYAIDNVVYTMPGLWELRVGIASQTVTDTIVFELDVE